MEKATTKYDFIEEDKRILERRVRQHRLSRQEHLKLLKSVPDDTERAAQVVVYSETILSSVPSSS